AHAQALDPAKRAELEANLANIEKEIETQRLLLSSKQKESVSLGRDISILNTQIKKSELAIKGRTLSIQKLSEDIASKKGKIGELSEQMTKDQSSLSEFTRERAKLDDSSFFELLLQQENLSQFLSDADQFGMVESSLHDLLDEIKDTKQSTEEAKTALEEKKTEELELKGIQELEKRRTAEKNTEKQKILKDSKGKEKEYQKILASREADAAAIRSALFQLSGTTAIPFGVALEYANFASQKTGIRPAFLLGIIAEETNLGENIGKGNWLVDMHPTRDRPVFEQITSKLGLDPNKMPVSKKAWYGWGGAMGPAQFIPSTWVLYESRVAQVLGKSVVSPWDPKDAFTASAILLTDNGAVNGNYASERLAALRYLAGWKNATKSAYAFYGDDVMGLASKFERQIDILSR
ncbi:MAG: lytic murein transglycosylase, partial [Patescibacteria group bacterium]